jgi:hypothetical protein
MLHVIPCATDIRCEESCHIGPDTVESGRMNFFVLLHAYLISILKVEAVSSSETSVICYWSTQRHISQNCTVLAIGAEQFYECSVCNTATRNEGVYQVTHRENCGFRNSGASAIKTWGNHETLMIAPPLSQTSSFSNAPMLGVLAYSATSLSL